MKHIDGNHLNFLHYFTEFAKLLISGKNSNTENTKLFQVYFFFTLIFILSCKNFLLAKFVLPLGFGIPYSRLAKRRGVRIWL